MRLSACLRVLTAGERAVRQEEEPRREADRLRPVGEARPRPGGQGVDGDRRVRGARDRRPRTGRILHGHVGRRRARLHTVSKPSLHSRSLVLSVLPHPCFFTGRMPCLPPNQQRHMLVLLQQHIYQPRMLW